jgi:hypothetical protein
MEAMIAIMRLRSSSTRAVPPDTVGEYKAKTQHLLISWTSLLMELTTCAKLSRSLWETPVLRHGRSGDFQVSSTSLHSKLCEPDGRGPWGRGDRTVRYFFQWRVR